jgi:hypothetical protein
MAPELIAEFVRAVQKEINLQRREDGVLRDAKNRELAEVTRKLDGLIDAIADGLRAPGLQLTELFGNLIPDYALPTTSTASGRSSCGLR